MKLSILDQSPISAGKTAADALQESTKLAQVAENLGYKRYWIAEHHGIPGLASPNPSVMLSYIGAQTSKIRLGAGAVLLPHYSPYFIAETYNLLATLFPNRIDLGIGRAPGASAEATIALSGNFLGKVKAFSTSLDELINFLYEKFPQEHMYSKVKQTIVLKKTPQPWLLGTSERSAILAAEKGLPYTFGHFMSTQLGPSIIKTYNKNFKRNYSATSPKVIVTVSVICAETTEEAEELASSALLWEINVGNGQTENGVPSVKMAKEYSYSKEELIEIEKSKQRMIIGNPMEVKKQLQMIQSQYDINEIMIVTITHSYQARLKSYELIANEIWNG